jgi:hypothetical protein
MSQIAEYMIEFEKLLGVPATLISIVQDEPATENPAPEPETPRTVLFPLGK